MADIFYYTEVKTRYNTLVSHYTMLINTYREIICNNENYIRINFHNISQETSTTMTVDNALFQQLINDYSHTICGLNSYVSLLDARIREMTNDCCDNKNNACEMNAIVDNY